MVIETCVRTLNNQKNTMVILKHVYTFPNNLLENTPDISVQVKGSICLSDALVWSILINTHHFGVYLVAHAHFICTYSFPATTK